MRTLQHAPKSRCCSAAFKALSVVVLGVILAATLAVPAAAHTGFESSSPAQGESIDEPVGEIKIVFTGAAEPSGEGFAILDPTGAVREPASAVSVDSLMWTLTFSEPLAGGTTGVRWTVAATDAHPINGSFSFTVNASVPVVRGTRSVPSVD